MPTTLTDTSSTWQALQTIPGLDARLGSDMLGHNTQAYQHLLRTFVTTHRADDQRLRTMAAAQDLQGLQSCAHSLRGSASTICADAIARAAWALESMLNTTSLHQPVDHFSILLASQTLADTLSAMLTALDQALPPAT